jgi:hypothetical protein
VGEGVGYGYGEEGAEEEFERIDLDLVRKVDVDIME